MSLNIIARYFTGKFRQMVSKFKKIFFYSLYLRFSILLSCIAVVSLMMLVGFFFLLDYIPASQTAIQAVGQRKLEWSLAISHSDFSISPRPWDEYTFAGSNSDGIWYSQHQFSLLSFQISGLKAKELAIHASDDPDYIRFMAERILQDHDAILYDLRRDVEEKQAVLVMLQIIGLLLLFLCLGSIAYLLKKVLIDRVSRMIEILSIEGSWHHVKAMDELVPLEYKVQEMVAKIEGLKAETEWFDRTKSGLLRHLIRARKFVHKLIILLQENHVNESTIRTMVYDMEDSLNLENVAVRFILDENDGQGERLIYSQRKPEKFPENLLRDMNNDLSVKFKSSNGGECIAASFTCPGESLGLLILEAEAGHEFYESDITLAEITAQLLSMVMGAKSREEQARRLALFEERTAIARELHDSLAQSLSFMKIQISRLQAHPELQTGTPGEILGQLREGLDNAYRELRELLSTFRMHMDVRGLGFAIQAAVEEFSNRSSLSIIFDNRLVNCRLTVNEEFHILHVIREALSNIIRHADAQHVVITSTYVQGSTVNVTIDDDGIGMAEANHEYGHYGQSIMRDRAYSLGGDIAVTSKRGGGTRVRLVFTPKLPQ